MSGRALIKLARCYDPALVLADGWKPAERTLFQAGALEFAGSDVPLIVDHDGGREIGTVHELVEYPDTDGRWLAARATVTDPPEWLRRGTKASFEYVPVAAYPAGEWTRVSRGVVTEVSVLSPSVQPAESRAQVLVFEPDVAMRAGEEIHVPRQLVRRYYQTPIVVR